MREQRSPWFYISLVLLFLLLMSGVSGIVDGFVEWRARIGPIVKTYVATRTAVIGLLPWQIPNWLGDYFVIGSGIAIAGRMALRPFEFIFAITSMRLLTIERRASGFTGRWLRSPRLFGLFLLVVFWPLFVWSAWQGYRRSYRSTRDFLLPQAQASENKEFLATIETGLRQQKSATYDFLWSIAWISFALLVILFLVVDYQATLGTGASLLP
ncbi:MAG: hypothetical protein QNJ09_03705 [Paracoccaceae bacterium]|nr:hypothetical protein [Paracoccaceae bacterium]